MQDVCIMGRMQDFKNICPVTVMRHLRTGKERTRRAYGFFGFFLSGFLLIERRGWDSNPCALADKPRKATYFLAKSIVHFFAATLVATFGHFEEIPSYIYTF